MILLGPAVGQGPIMSSLNLVSPVPSLPPSQHQASHLQLPVTLSVPSGSCDILVFSLCPSSQNSYFSGYHTKTEDQRTIGAKQDGPLKGEAK